MRKLSFLIVILISLPVFATCPIDGISDACVAGTTALPNLMPSESAIPSNSSNKIFTETPSTSDITREIKPIKTQNFGVTGQDYGYNSSCQFGVCMDTGTPKNFNDN